MQSAKWWADMLYLNTMTREEMEEYIREIQDEAYEKGWSASRDEIYQLGFNEGGGGA